MQSSPPSSCTGLTKLVRGVESLELRTMLQGDDDHREAIVTIHPGAGGTESQDWAEMLMRMYTRWAERHGYQVNVLDLQPGPGGRYQERHRSRSAARARTGTSRRSAGVHRLVRISPFDAQSRGDTPPSRPSSCIRSSTTTSRSTSTRPISAIDTYRASGAGGQHVNKTDSAVRITHEPTGIVVSCQQERSQHKNRSTAMKMLRAALYQRALEEKEAERAAMESSKTDIDFGSQIRSYVFQPYTMVNDHRTETKIGDVQAVMDGQLDPLIEAYLKQAAR